MCCIGVCLWSNAHSQYFTIWNKSAWYESSRMLWYLYSRVCFLALLLGGVCSGPFLIFQYTQIQDFVLGGRDFSANKHKVYTVCLFLSLYQSQLIIIILVLLHVKTALLANVSHKQTKYPEVGLNMAGDQISSETVVSTHTRLSSVPQLLSPATAGQQTCLMLFLAPELHVSVQKPLNAN